MKIATAAVICFTEHGAVLARKIKTGLLREHITCEIWIKKQGTQADVRPLEGSLREWTGAQFQEKDALVFIGAAGIAVRSIAPFIKSKKTDPAVIVLDEQGRHAISLLSGHMGGANALTRRIAEFTGAEPVITTATDLHGKFAVDEFAARRELYLDSMACAKEIAARLVEGKTVGMWSEFPVEGAIPPELERVSSMQKPAGELGFCISVCKRDYFQRTLHLVPRIVVLGIGCKKHTDTKTVETMVVETLKAHGIFKESVKKLVSIDLKKEEEGLLALAEKWRIPFETYTADELAAVESEDGFAESDFVKAVTGVGNVCERAALLGAGPVRLRHGAGPVRLRHGADARRLLIPKTAGNGVTVAAALEDYRVTF